MRRSSTLRAALASSALALLLAASGPALADLDDVRAELTRNIQTSQRELSAAEAAVGRERGELAQRLAAAQNRVLDLREKAAAARRLADEKTLTLQQIETRLNTWRDQSRFQKNLLAGFLDKTGKRRLSEQQGEIDVRKDLALLAEHVDEQQARLHPRWQKGRVVLPEGDLADGDVLTVGPAAWFARAQPEQSGLIRKDKDITRVSLLFAGAADAGIQDLHRGSTGVVTFDPTLSRAMLLAEQSEPLLTHLRRGGFWAIPIVLFGVFASVIAVLKAVHLYRLPTPVPALAERVQSALARGGDARRALAEQVAGPQGELVSIAIASQANDERDDRLHATLLQQRIKLERWLGAIAITASVSPLLGLLGTVSGMITTFKAMSLFGAGDASAVSGGVGEALINTELGLVVAIPALLAHALMSRKAKSYLAQLESDAVHLSRLPLDTGAA
ncbi:MAG TPA: MotA/TolQ/ExbB proton channel family protein [Gammaproteobacteria bacterium]|nr:MotA/TolQ/ExbB proton channel family protein [Gammaproteobacteria bacterium]